MKLNEKQLEQLKLNIEYIFDSGANELRILNMVELFIEQNTPKYEEIEVFHIKTDDDGTKAYISYRNANDKSDNMNDGYDTIQVPFNLRAIQLSSRDNYLVNQSVKNYETSCN